MRPTTAKGHLQSDPTLPLPVHPLPACRAARARAAVMDAAAVAEKKAAILERALSHNRTEPQLLLGLLQAAAPLLDAPTLCTRWEHVISRWRALDTPNCALGTALLWTEYLRMRRNQFALFKVQRLQVRGCGAGCLGLACSVSCCMLTVSCMCCYDLCCLRAAAYMEISSMCWFDAMISCACIPCAGYKYDHIHVVTLHL